MSKNHLDKLDEQIDKLETLVNIIKLTKNTELTTKYYCGETTRLKRTIDKVIKIIEQFGQIDGEEHKMWLIDQIIRELLDDDYENWVKEYEQDDDGNVLYGWDTGVAP